MNAPRLHGEIESPRPLRASAGEVRVEGWCLLEDSPAPPEVRLRTDAAVLPATARLERTDVPRLFPAAPAAAQCGFAIAGRLPPGVHLARFEARLPDDSWRAFKTLSLAVEAPPLAASVETTAPDGVLHARVHVEGWALDPAREASAISLRYGHQDLPCDSGAARTDTPLLYPDSPHAARAGFRSRTILAAGRGPLRVRARFADGTAAVAPTGLRVEIETDENHPPGLGLDAARVPLPGYERRPPAPAARAARPLNLLFVLHGDFTANSSLQACALANELADAGHDCVLAVPRDRGTLRHQDAPRFRACLHAEAAATGGAFADGRGPDFVHAWTTRECIREVATEIRRRHGGGLVVHLEDNEQALLAHALGRPWEELAALPDVELDALVPADLAHPRRAAAFLAAADGVTVIVDRLREFVPAGKPCATVWPAADARYFFPRPKPAAFRRLLEGRADETVIFYHGNVHAANAAEMRELYAAIAALDADGVPVRLIRAGVDQVAFMDADLARRVAPRVLNLGQILNHRHLPPLMALADLFVQPGAPDAFNDYRFPSKLPEFFALGRPVVLPRSNLGESLRHGEDAWVLPRADAAGIAAAIRELRARPDLADRLARGAAEFARRHLDWRRSAATLANFYAGLTRS